MDPSGLQLLEQRARHAELLHALCAQAAAQQSSSQLQGTSISASGADAAVSQLPWLLSLATDRLAGKERHQDTLRSLVQSAALVSQVLAASATHAIQGQGDAGATSRSITECIPLLLGQQGCAVAHHLSEHTALLEQWLDVQLAALRAVKQACVALPAPVPMALWVAYKVRGGGGGGGLLCMPAVCVYQHVCTCTRDCVCVHARACARPG